MPEGKNSAHGTGTYGERQQRDLLGGENLPEHKRRRMTGQMTGQGFFDTPQVSLESPSVKAEKTPRALRFEKGTVLYKVVPETGGKPKIPEKPREEKDLRGETLLFDQDLEVDESCIGLGKRGREVIKIIGKSNYGAFVIVRYHKTDDKGQEVVEERLASLTQRRLKGKNEKLIIKESNH
jgi:hypothetical protein